MERQGWGEAGRLSSLGYTGKMPAGGHTGTRLGAQDGHAPQIRTLKSMQRGEKGEGTKEVWMGPRDTPAYEVKKGLEH